MAFSINCPSLYFFLYLALPSAFPLKPLILVSPLSYYNTVFYFAFLNRSCLPTWSLTIYTTAVSIWIEKHMLKSLKASIHT